jgi:beta-galactosidase
VEIVDADGRLNPNADNLVHFTVTGPGRILGVCSADPRSVESFQQPQRKAFRGRCLVVIKAGEQPGSIRLKASADGLREADVMLETAAPPGRQ